MFPSLRGFVLGCVVTGVVTCVATLVACSGSSGGGGSRGGNLPDAVPTLSGATFIGGATPAAGDRLLLILSEDVALASGATVDDTDFVIANGANAGSVGAIGTPTLKNARTLEITLGAGVTFTPGTSTIDFAATNDAITDRTGNLAVAGTAVTIADGDGDDPSISNLTLSAVDDTLNGRGAAGGTLQVPSGGFTIDLIFGDASNAVDVDRTIVVSSVVVDVNGTSRQPGVNLTDAFTHTSAASSAELTVPTTVTFPTGTFELTVYVVDTTGMISDAATFTGAARENSDALRPFETTVNPSQVWFIDTSRDIESFSVNVLDFVTPARVHNGANGRSDLLDLLYVVGLQSTSPIPNVSGGKDSNELVFEAFQAEVLKHLTTLFAGANVTFTFTAPGAWPGGSSRPYASVGFSQIALAGAEHENGRSGTHGVAIFDPNNVNQDDDTQLAFGGSQRLGVFLHTIINDGLVAHPTTLFRTTFDPFTPARFGTPIGDDAWDGFRLTGAVLDTRTTELANAVLRLAKFAAVILAHEVGHSVGLVKNGATPGGLFGNDATNFPVFPVSAADGHIKMPASLFPGVSENIMSPAFDFDSALAPQTKFNSLNHAYLRERIVVGN